MAIWVITIGNSDVQLKTDSNWQDLFLEVNTEPPINICHDDNNKFLNIKQDDLSSLYPIPARVLGIVYQDKLKEYFEDFAFPLLDIFFDYFDRDNILDLRDNIPDKIIILLTDQSSIFDTDGKKSYPESPYWQDTIELERILNEYFSRKLKERNIKCQNLLFKTLEPQADKEGLDHWEDTLSLVEETIHQAIEQIHYSSSQKERVYVSHQAATPAISSSVQFVSLSKFNNVKFLVSNPSYDVDKLNYKPQCIDSSKYQRGIQIQKAKQLIQSGLPGAALNILDNIDISPEVKSTLEEKVRFFNIESELAKNGKFESLSAIVRVVAALELISCFFKEQNYIQGITLLAAAHETFLKAVIIKELYSKYTYFTIPLNGNTKRLRVKDIIEWNKTGLAFVKNPKDKELWEFDNHLKNLLSVNVRNIKSQKIDILKQLSFPIDSTDLFQKLDKGEFGNFSVIGSNTGMLEWIRRLRSDFVPWKLMEFIGQYNRGYEDDRRNQLMHNLVGAKPEEVIQYLLGNHSNSNYYDTTGVLSAYEKEVKTPFLDEIKRLGIPYQESNLQEELQEIASKLR